MDAETARLLDFGATLWRMSDGRVRPDFRRVAATPGNSTKGRLRANPARIPELMQRIGWQRVSWEPPILTLPDGMEIDFGGIGKEYAVDLVADWMRPAHANARCS